MRIQHHRIKLHIRDKFILAPDRYNDTTIIQDMNNKYTSSTKRKKYNACRMYLRITFLSELCNPEGTSLNIILLNNTSNNRVKSRFWWPNQTKPGTKYWNDWMSYLRQTYCVLNSHHLQHRYQLGKGWLHTITETAISTSISLHLFRRSTIPKNVMSNIANILAQEHIQSSLIRQHVLTLSLLIQFTLQ